MKRMIAALFLTIFSVGTIYTAIPPTPVAAACNERILTFPTWYRGVTKGGQCRILIDSFNDFWVIALNIVEILIQFAAYVAAGYIIWGGIKYIKSQGNSSAVGEAKAVIINAVIGLTVAILAASLVEFIAGRFR